MALLTDYFIAADDVTAASVVRFSGGPAGAAWQSVTIHGLEPVVTMGTLEEMLTSRPFAQVVGNPRQGQVLAERDGALVVTVTAELQDALARADHHLITEVAQVWAVAQELGSTDPIAFAEALMALAGLCRDAQDTRAAVYCWLAA
jgi:hypothetical protein